MNGQRIAVFDIETVPDLQAGRAVLGASSDVPDDDVRRMLGEKYAKVGQEPSESFIKVPLHKIVCIGALYAERTDRNMPWLITRSGVGHIGIRTERQLVSGFIESLNSAPSPLLVGFNSSSFDLPVLRYRAFALSVPAQTIHKGNGRDYWYRFGRDHLDLCDVISGYGASARPSLGELAALCGVPAKAAGVNGSQIEHMINAEQFDEVAAYCETDVLATYLICLRFGLVTGEVNQECYELSLADLRKYIEDRTDKRPHLLAYLAALRT